MYNDYQRVHYITIVTEVNLNVLKSNLINCGLVLASIYEKITKYQTHSGSFLFSLTNDP